MALNPAFEGRVYAPSGPYVVGREKVREFAAAIGDANPACSDLDAARALGYRDLVAPPTFAVIASMRAFSAVVHDPELGLDFSRLVHGDQRFSFVRPIVAGDELTVTTTIESIRSVAGNDMLITRADISAVQGESVATAWSMFVCRGTEDAEQ